MLYYWVLYYWRLLVRGTVVLPRGPVRLSVDSLRLLDAASHEPAGRWVLLCPTCVALTNLTIIMGLSSLTGTAGLKRYISIASRCGPHPHSDGLGVPPEAMKNYIFGGSNI